MKSQKRTAAEIRPQVDVTAALIWKNNQLLIARRQENDSCGGQWEFPGGKKEDGEDLQTCLRREIKEELGIEIEVRELFTQVTGDFEKAIIVIYVFQCRYLDGVPQAIECADCRWITIPELRQYNFTRLDQAIVQKLSGGSVNPDRIYS